MFVRADDTCLYRHEVIMQAKCEFALKKKTSADIRAYHFKERLITLKCSD